jgi:hypothetical protein
VSQGDRATPEPKRICKSSISPKFTYHPVHNRRRAMWRLSNAQALIFVAAVACRAGERRPRWSHSLCTGSLGHEHRPLVPEARQGHPEQTPRVSLPRVRHRGSDGRRDPIHDVVCAQRGSTPSLLPSHATKRMVWRRIIGGSLSLLIGSDNRLAPNCAINFQTSWRANSPLAQIRFVPLSELAQIDLAPGPNRLGLILNRRQRNR